MPAAPSDVVVVGGGVIGCAVAWRCAQRGLRVTVVDPAPARGAWHTAAGMLAPAGELHTTERALLRLNLESLARWRGFADELSADTGGGDAGRQLGYRECGTVTAAWDGADLAALRQVHELAGTLGVRTELLSGRELRALEPTLAAGLPGGLHAPDDHQVDPRLLHAALGVAATRRGVRFVESTAAVVLDGGRVRGVRLDDGEVRAAGHVVLAAGAWTSRLEGLPEHAGVPVRPVKGQTLRLHLTGDTRIGRVVRGTVAGSPVYVVPRADGSLVVGASTDEAGFDVSPRAGAVYELLRDAQALVPELGEAVLDEVCTGLRPTTPDNAPVLGAAAVDGLVWATGHYRNGILLAPVTADAVAGLLADGRIDEAAVAFGPQRFAAVPA